MANLYELLDNAHDGEGISALGREFGLTPEQTQRAINALLPAISIALKQSTATVDGLGRLLATMGEQQDLHAMYDDAETAFGDGGVRAGNEALSVIFGAPEVSRAVANQAQQFSGVSSAILQKLLPVVVGMILSGLMRRGSSGSSATPQHPSGGTLGDILGQIFGREMPGTPGMPPGRPQQFPAPGRQSSPPPSPPADSGEDSGGDLLGTILRELQKGIQEGRIKPVIIEGGPRQMPAPGGPQAPMPSEPETPQMPGGDVFGQILRDIFHGDEGGSARMPQNGQRQSPQIKELSERTKQLGRMGGAGAAVFGDHFEVGQDVDENHVENIQNVLQRFQAPR
jgi:hypothetical protein